MEQSQLLDPHLTNIVSELMRISRKVIGLNEQKMTFVDCMQERLVRICLFQTICTLTKVRGHKVVSKLSISFPMRVF